MARWLVIVLLVVIATAVAFGVVRNAYAEPQEMRLVAEDYPPAGDGMVVPDPSLDDAQGATSDPLYFGVRATYFIWTQGRFSQTLDIGLDPARRYLITGALTGKSGGTYGQIYLNNLPHAQH